MRGSLALSIEPTEGFTRLPQSALCFVLGAGSIYLQTHALETPPKGIAYAVFTGIGAVGIVIMGIVLAADPATPGRLAPIAPIVVGIVRPQAVLGRMIGRPRREDERRS